MNTSTPELRRDVLRSILPEDAKVHHALLKSIFDKEMAYRQADDELEYYENLYWCAFLLYKVGDPADSIAMWQAKHINMDTGCGFEIQNLVGAGVEETISRLRDLKEETLAQELIRYQEHGDFDCLDDWEDWKRQYFYGSK